MLAGIRTGRVCVAMFLAALLTGPLAAAPDTSKDALPEWLSPYWIDGSLQMDNVGWLQPRFHPADPVEAKKWQALLQWLEARKRERTAAVRSELASLGAPPATALKSGCFGDDACRMVDDIVKLIESSPKLYPGFETFSAAARDANSAAEGFRLAVQTAWHVAAKDTVEQRLQAARLCDEAFLIAQYGVDFPERKLPKLSPAAQPLFWLALTIEWHRQERVHLDFVRALLSKGWPPDSEIGPSGKEPLWLIIQHATDEDFGLQYRMLLLMGPAYGEDWQHDRAYLYDRVMLKIVGKQRYGTQLDCVGGHYELSPLEEDRSELDAQRKSVGLIPFADYLKYFSRSCSPAPE